MPRVVEGSQADRRSPRRALGRVGFRAVAPVVAAGGGDNAAGAVGVGVVHAGQALLSLGTSGVVFLVTERFAPNPAHGVHAFCHAIPETWHQMSVMLSSASCLTWVASATGAQSEAALIAEIEAHASEPGTVLFLPYLSGERTPHNDPKAQGVFFGLTHDATRARLGRAVLEGVAFAFADGLQSLREAGGAPHEITVIGGGSRSLFWMKILASVLGETLLVRERAELGPAFGAARLARLAVTGEPLDDVCSAPPIASRIEPEPALQQYYSGRIGPYRDLYQRLRTAFPA